MHQGTSSCSFHNWDLWDRNLIPLYVGVGFHKVHGPLRAKPPLTSTHPTFYSHPQVLPLHTYTLGCLVLYWGVSAANPLAGVNWLSTDVCAQGNQLLWQADVVWIFSGPGPHGYDTTIILIKGGSWLVNQCWGHRMWTGTDAWVSWSNLLLSGNITRYTTATGVILDVFSSYAEPVYWPYQEYLLGVPTSHWCQYPLTQCSVCPRPCLLICKHIVPADLPFLSSWSLLWEYHMLDHQVLCLRHHPLPGPVLLVTTHSFHPLELIWPTLHWLELKERVLAVALPASTKEINNWINDVTWYANAKDQLDH